VGAAIAAVLGTLCCIGPAVIAVVGAGGALAGAKLAPYRPYFLAASGLLLGLGFWSSYRPSPANREGTSCTLRTGRRVRTVLWIAAAVTAASFLVPRFL
jgi:mercuric ion transport protein